MAEMNDIVEAVLKGKLKQIGDTVQAALDGGADPDAVLADGLVNSMDVVAEKWKAGEVFVPEVLRSAKAMQTAMDVLRPHLSGQESAGVKGYVIGTVEGDQHDIGKNLVALMLEGVGFKVVDLGTGVTPRAFVEAVKEHKPKILGMSALLTTTRLKMEETIIALKEANLRDQVKIMCGGAPVTKKFVEDIGGDGYGANAAAAVDKAKELVS